MQPDVDPLAPTQIYIVLAITIATLSWLVRPDDIEQLEKRWGFLVGALVIGQVIHCLIYANLAWLANQVMHGVALAAYIVMGVTLFTRSWTRFKSRPPGIPADDEYP